MLKLVYISGEIVLAFLGGGNRWGVSNFLLSGRDYFVIILTNKSNSRILPIDANILEQQILGYQIPGFNVFSPEIVLNFTPLLDVKSGEEYRLWHGDDLKDWFEFDNGGRICVDVYMMYITFVY